MVDITPQAIAQQRAKLCVPADRLPRSVAIIMDGNGRWAREKSLPRPVGHKEGAQMVRKIVSQAAAFGLDALTLYSFSIENWSRPDDEVNALMHLYADYLVRERPTIMENNIRMRHLGRRDGLPQSVLTELDESLRVSADNTGMFLCLALNYGSRGEIIEAVRKISSDVKNGSLAPEDITDDTLSNALDTREVPDPDLLIRTAGEMRISNFLLWQISYAELYVTDVYWPEFDETQFAKALTDYAQRHRRFGGVDESNT